MSTMTQMRAVVTGAKDHLVIEQRARPHFPNDTHLVYAKIRVYAFGVNRADLLQRSGHYPPPSGVPADILGLEFAGVIEGFSDELSESDAFSVGDRVMGICDGAAYAEYVVVPRDQLIPLPENCDFPQAASIPEAHLTAFDALYRLASVQRGERVLIHAIGSGVGVAAAKIAHFLGAEVYGTTRSEWKRDKALSDLPVTDVWLSRDHHFLDENGRSKFDVIIDFIGAAYLKENLKALRSGGRIIAIGLLGGIKGEINLAQLLAKRATLRGTVLRSRSAGEKIELTRQYCSIIAPYLMAFDPPNEDRTETCLEHRYIQIGGVHKIYPATEMESAHQDLENGVVWSKVVGVWDSTKD